MSVAKVPVSSTIVLTDLVLPNDVEMTTRKTAVVFQRGPRKAVLKSKALEITNPIKELGKRVKVYSDKVIENCHLGNIQAIIPKIQDTVDLQKILNRYFKSKSKAAIA